MGAVDVLLYGPLPEMIGAHPSMREVFRMVRLAAPTELPIAIVGETGTGKELVARAIHKLSRRSRGPFLPVNAAAVPLGLFESELFGHEEGAFSDARKAKPGLIEIAHAGTLFCDELTALSYESQAKLLRAVEEGAVRRVGGITVRAAAPRWLVSCQGFQNGSRMGRGVREDLWHRVSSAIIALPPLRDRTSDIPDLVAAFIAEAGGRVDRLEQSALDVLMAAPWPGNVRELRQAIFRLVLGANGGRITAANAKREVRGAHENGRRRGPERSELLRVLTGYRWNLRRAAGEFGVARGTLYRWLHDVGLERPRMSRVFNEHVQDT